MSLSLKPSHLGTYKDLITLYFKYGRAAQKERDDLSAEFDIDDNSEPSEKAQDFAADLERLGPTYVKLGQLLSTRPDLMPPEWLQALAKLQDDVEEIPYDEVQAIIEEELGVRISRGFSHFDETPLAAASIGQVHRAILRDGKTEVAVKVQRPGVRKAMFEQLEAFGEMADFLSEKTELGRHYEVHRIVAQFRQSLMKELSYGEEARNLDRLRENLDRFPHLVIPHTFPDLCSDKVLTMEYLDGSRITDLSGVVRSEIDGAQLADELFKGYLQQVLVDGFFHADPHPGNVLITLDRKLAIFDLGMVGHVPDRLRDNLLSLLSAVAEGKAGTAAKITEQIGTPLEGYDENELERRIVDIVNERQGATAGDIQIGGLVLQVTTACAKSHLRIPDAMFMLGKMLLNLDMVASSLDPDFDPNLAIRREAGRLTQARIRDEFRPANLVHLLGEAKELITETPTRLNSLFDKLASNKLKLEVDAIDETMILHGFYKVANRITMGLILAALIIGAAMMMNIESSWNLFGYPGLAILFFLFAAIGGSIMVVKIMMSEADDQKKK